jgi:hypothetical protein
VQPRDKLAVLLRELMDRYEEIPGLMVQLDSREEEMDQALWGLQNGHSVPDWFAAVWNDWEVDEETDLSMEEAFAKLLEHHSRPNPLTGSIPFENAVTALLDLFRAYHEGCSFLDPLWD